MGHPQGVTCPLLPVPVTAVYCERGWGACVCCFLPGLWASACRDLLGVQPAYEPGVVVGSHWVSHGSLGLFSLSPSLAPTLTAGTLPSSPPSIAFHPPSVICHSLPPAAPPCPYLPPPCSFPLFFPSVFGLLVSFPLLSGVWTLVLWSRPLLRELLWGSQRKGQVTPF